MSRGYLPNRDGEFSKFVSDLYQNLSTKPANYYGLSEQVITEYHTTLTRWLEAYAVASNPVTRTRPTIEAKSSAKKTLINATRSIVEVMQAWPQMTDEKRRELGITVRDRKPTPSPRPSLKPYLEVERVDGNSVWVRIMQSSTERRAKPKGVIGAILYSAVGPTPPTNESGWFSQGNTTKTNTLVTFPDTVPPGSRVWFTAVWFNRRAETGPAASPIGTNLPGGAAFSKAA